MDSTQPLLQSAPSGLRNRMIGRFFYAEEVPFGLAMIRMLMPLVVLIPMLKRVRHIRELYSADGAPAQLSYGFGDGNLMPELPGGVAVALYAAMLFVLVTSSLGWRTRLSLIAATVLYTYFNLLDCVGTMTKYSVIAVHILLLLGLSNCGSVWSIDSLLQRTRRRARWPGEGVAPWLGPQSTLLPKSPVWPRRLMQLLIGSVYFGAAITKIHTPEFFSGDQLRYWMITNLNHENWLGEFLTLFPAVLVVFAYITIIWEVVFVFIAWNGWSRPIMLAIGAVFHVMTFFTLGLHTFPLICLTIYISFLEEADVVRFSAGWRRWKRKVAGTLRVPSAKVAGFARSRATIPHANSGESGYPSAHPAEEQPARIPLPAVPQPLRFPSPVLFAFLLLLAAVVGVELEYHQDPYGLRRPDGPHALVETDADLVEAMIGPEVPLRESDKFFSFDLGTVLIGGALANRKSVFRHGDMIIAQCSLNPPHEDMWVECNLHDADDRRIERVGMVVSREMLRCNFQYRMFESLEPGDYYLVIQSRGREITRRPFTLLPDAKRPLAN